MRPIESLPSSVNQRAPSGPEASPHGRSTLGARKLLTFPAVVMRPIELPRLLANQSAPSGPTVIPRGPRMLGSW